MSEILGRDSLGRLVYEGDRIRWKWADIAWPPAHPVGDGKHVKFDGHDWWMPINSECIVDLDASPKHTNYERYFAEFGDVDAVIDMFYDSCLRERCWECAFEKWGEAFGIEIPKGCTGFVDWLDREVVI